MAHYVDLLPSGLFKAFLEIGPGDSVPQTARQLTEEQYAAWSSLGNAAFTWPSGSAEPIRVEAGRRYFVDVDEDGKFVGFYIPEVMGRPLPETARPISEEQYQAWQVVGAEGYRFPPDADEPIAWVLPDDEALASAILAKEAELRSAVQAAVVAGVTSDALGSPHTYPTDLTSQHNMEASVTAAILDRAASNWTTPFKCADSEGVWMRRPHTAAQIIAVGKDMKKHVLANLLKFDQLIDRVNAAETAAEVDLIRWGA